LLSAVELAGHVLTIRGKGVPDGCLYRETADVGLSRAFQRGLNRLLNILTKQLASNRDRLRYQSRFGQHHARPLAFHHFPKDPQQCLVVVLESP
jgi:hypothetical protein